MAALQAYRNVLRSARKAFEGDLHLLEAAKLQANTAFRQNAALDPKSKETEDAIVHANDVAKILRQNIVQGRAIGDDKYKLRIHDEIERGDNDSIKQSSGKHVHMGGKGCCGGAPKKPEHMPGTHLR